MTFVLLEGSSLDVTETAVQYRSVFAPYALNYLFYELENAFRPNDLGNYFRGNLLPLMFRCYWTETPSTGGMVPEDHIQARHMSRCRAERLPDQ